MPVALWLWTSVDFLSFLDNLLEVKAEIVWHVPEHSDSALRLRGPSIA